MKQSLLILAAIIGGIILPYGHLVTFLIKYNLMIMLFFAFLNIRFSHRIFDKYHLRLTLVNLTLPLLLYAAVLPFGSSLAITAFIISFAPTAAAAPVIGQFLKTDISFITASVLLSNPLIAILLPFVLPLLLPLGSRISVLEVLIPVLTVVGIPMITSMLCRRLGPSFTNRILEWKSIAFYLFVFNVWLACGNAIHFLKNEGAAHLSSLLPIVLVTALVCVLTFQIGERLVPAKLRFAGGLAIGRKNTMFSLWLALTFVSPLVALGPIAYIIIQNIYNSYQIYMQEQHEKRAYSLSAETERP